MIRQAAFEGIRELLKGALHTHTTRSSSGHRISPEELLWNYKRDGYDFVAITDHRIYNFKNFAPETGLLIIPGIEIDALIEDRRYGYCFHTVVLGRGKENNPYEQDQRFETERVKDQFEFQKLLDNHHANGQITCYCHPEWSYTPAGSFDNLEGNFAMEIWNSVCALGRGMDTDAAYWDDLLRSGKRLFGCATDDCHSSETQCVGWVWVNSEKDIDSVLEALQNGAFYSSCGPVIKDFYVRDRVAVVDCSPCCDVAFRGGMRPFRDQRRMSSADDLTHIEVEIPSCDTYLRVTVTDKQGRKAWSNPIFFE